MSYNPYSRGAKQSRGQRRDASYEYKEQSIDDGIGYFEWLINNGHLKSGVILCGTNLPDKPFSLISLGTDLAGTMDLVKQAQETIDGVVGKDG